MSRVAAGKAELSAELEQNEVQNEAQNEAQALLGRCDKRPESGANGSALWRLTVSKTTTIVRTGAVLAFHCSTALGRDGHCRGCTWKVDAPPATGVTFPSTL